jgi:hypothetical protein
MGMKSIDTGSCRDSSFDGKDCVVIGNGHPLNCGLANPFPKENFHGTGIRNIDKEQIQNHERPTKWN